MRMLVPVRELATRWMLVLLLVGLSACAPLLPDSEFEQPAEPVAQVEPPPEIAAEPVPMPEPPAQTQTEPEPAPPPEPPNIAPLIAVVISDGTPAYADVAKALSGRLDSHRIFDLAAGKSAADVFATIEASRPSAVVAIGIGAARAAERFSSAPVVISQVFNIEDAGLLGDRTRAVAVLPPFERQLDTWLEIDPGIKDVGAILGQGHEELIAEAEAAMKARGIQFHYAIAGSDRETLYLFNRLVREIDGYLLFPDNRILSRDVLTELMATAGRNRVEVGVFNDPLLQIGATFSTAAVDEDIARSITRVLNQIIDGRIDDVPPVSPLQEARVSANPGAIRRLGLNMPGQPALVSSREQE